VIPSVYSYFSRAFVPKTEKHEKPFEGPSSEVVIAS